MIESGHVHDVAVVGAGPAGLASAVYARRRASTQSSSRPWRPEVRRAPARRSRTISAFPTGISGQALAGRAQVQAQKFGARLVVSRPVTGLDCTGTVFGLKLEDGIRIERAPW